VALQVIDRGERQPLRRGERLRRGEADEQRPDQPRALRRGDQLQLVQLDPSLVQRALDDRVDQLEVMA